MFTRYVEDGSFGSSSSSDDSTPTLGKKQKKAKKRKTSERKSRVASFEAPPSGSKESAG